MLFKEIVDGRTDARTHARTDNGRRTLKDHKSSLSTSCSGELKIRLGSTFWQKKNLKVRFYLHVFIFKEKHGLLSEYLHELFPGTVQEISDNRYAIGNNESFASVSRRTVMHVARRTEVYAKSVIPSSLSLWNYLDANIRSADSLNAFKNKLKLLYQLPTVPYYFKTFFCCSSH